MLNHYQHTPDQQLASSYVECQSSGIILTKLHGKMLKVQPQIYKSVINIVAVTLSSRVSVFTCRAGTADKGQESKPSHQYT